MTLNGDNLKYLVFLRSHEISCLWFSNGFDLSRIVSKIKWIKRSQYGNVVDLWSDLYAFDSLKGFETFQSQVFEHICSTPKIVFS